MVICIMLTIWLFLFIGNVGQVASLVELSASQLHGLYTTGSLWGNAIPSNESRPSSRFIYGVFDNSD